MITGTLRKNPRGLEAIMVNPRPPKSTKRSSKKMATKRRRKRKKTPKRSKTGQFMKSNPAPKANPPRRRRRAKAKTKTKYKTRYKTKTRTIYKNPANPAPNPRRRRKRNPTEGLTNLKALVMPAIAAIGGFLLPGLAWFALGDKGREKVTGWFSKTKNATAWARASISGILTVGLFFLSGRINFLKKVRKPLMLGSVLRTGMDVADALISHEESGKTLRMIFALPVVAPVGITGSGEAGETYTGETPTQEGQYSGTSGVTYPMPSGYEGFHGTQYPEPSGYGDYYVNRRLQQAPQGGYPYAYSGVPGMGDIYVNRNLAYTEQGQKYPTDMNFRI